MKDYSLKINGHQYDVSIDEINQTATLARVVVNGVTYDVEIEGGKALKAKKPQVVAAPASTGLAVAPASTGQSRPAAAPVAAGGYKVSCPLPGTVLSVAVKVGDTVSAGQTLMVIEAMKMENNIASEKGGVVKQIMVQQGSTVMEGDVLAVIE